MHQICLTLNDFFNLQTAELFNAEKFENIFFVSIDSRNISKNCLFVAIKGKKYDGHNFLNEAVNKGASCVVVNKRKLKKLSNLKCPIVAVNDTTKALGELAAIWRKKLNSKIVAISGSNGKTTTKEIAADLLKEKFNVVSTVGNNNNHIGVPITLFSANKKTEIVVLELGTNHFGEIEYTSSIASPDLALITNIGNSHLEFLKNLNGVKKEKEALFIAASKNNGKILINNDDKLLKPLMTKYQNTFSFGFKNKNNISGNILKIENDGKTLLEVVYKNQKLKTLLPLAGENNAINFLAAVSIAFLLGLTKNEILNGISKVKPVKQRLNIREINSNLIIDDTYNANPESMNYAIKFLGEINKPTEKIAVLGDMFELGNKSTELHKGLVKTILQNKIDKVFTIGSKMSLLNQKLKEKNISAKHFRTRNNLRKYLNENNFSQSTILFKGSRGMKMEEFVKIFEGRIN